MVDWVLGIHLLIMVVLVVAMVQLLLTYINVNRDDPLIKAAETATKENHGTRVVVSSAYYWEPMDTCPLGCKVQLKTTPRWHRPIRRSQRTQPQTFLSMGTTAHHTQTMNIKALFHPPTAREMAAKEKQEAERLLLEAQTAKEFATQTEVYHSGRVARLTEYLKTFETTTA